MTRETDLLSFLDEILEMRVRNRATEAQQQADFIKINQKTLDFMENETNEEIKAALLKFEDMKNHYSGLMMDYMYTEGMKDGVMILRLLLKLILFQDI